MTDSPAAAPPLLTGPRLAVSLMFLANGFLIGSWAPKIPEFAARLNLDESDLGLMIVFFGVGSLCAMALVGVAIAHRGSQPVVRALAAMAAPSLLLVTFAPSVWSAALALFTLGGLIGGMDVAMNANAVEVERHERRAIMSSCHGFWSLGGVIGAGLGGLLISGPGVPAHSIIATLITALAIGLAWPRILADPPAAATNRPGPEHDGAAPRKGLLAAGATVWLTGIICLFMMTPEGAILDWGALYLRQELGASAAMSGLAFGAFSAAMALMRFLGDLVRDRFGAVRTFRVSSVLAILGMTIAGLAPTSSWAVIGFALTGLGLANTVPIAFSAAGNLPGLPQGLAISVVTFMGYSGILVAPSIIGFIAEHTGFARIFLALPLLIAVALALSGLTRHADMPTRDG
nr:MFS transporter [uncultured Hoeflea sp.]